MRGSSEGNIEFMNATINAKCVKLVFVLLKTILIANATLGPIYLIKLNEIIIYIMIVLK